MLCLFLGASLVLRAWAAPVAKPDAQPQRETVFSLIVKGGPVMVPLGICSVVALALAVERFIVQRRTRILPPQFVEGVLAELGRDPTAAGAIRFCDRIGGPIGKIFSSGLHEYDEGRDAVEKAMVESGAREVEKLKQSLRGLAHIVVVAPLLGLLGTITGLITCFQTATVAGMGKADVLAKGIYEALVTTAAGLMIAIPTLMVYDYLDARIDAYGNRFEELCVQFLSARFRKARSTAP
jgi:biopolymer transport protein ExbB